MSTDYIRHLRADGELMAEAASRDLDALDSHVPTCPEWNVGKLVIHTGGHHRWVADSVRRKGEPPGDPGKPGLRGAELIAWFRQGWQELADLLEATDDDAPAWTWVDEKRAAFWKRRTSLETLVHRWDAENATGARSTIDPILARDGVDEMMTIFVPRAGSGYKGKSGRVELRTSDEPQRWVLGLEDGKDPRASSDDQGGADVVVEAPASDLLLFLWGRVGSDVLQHEGDEGLFDHFVRWVES